MTPRQLTEIVLMAVFAGLGVYDVVVGILYGREATISMVLRDLSHRHPIIPFAFGMLAGHIFWGICYYWFGRQ